MAEFKFPKRVSTYKELNRLLKIAPKLPKTESGTGGALTKLKTIRDILWPSGLDVVVAYANAPDVLQRIVNGEEVGTYYKAPKRKNGRI